MVRKVGSILSFVIAIVNLYFAFDYIRSGSTPDAIFSVLIALIFIFVGVKFSRNSKKNS